MAYPLFAGPVTRCVVSIVCVLAGLSLVNQNDAWAASPRPGDPCSTKDLGKQVTISKAFTSDLTLKKRTEKALVQCAKPDFEGAVKSSITPPRPVWSIVGSLSPAVDFSPSKSWDFTRDPATDPCRLFPTPMRPSPTVDGIYEFAAPEDLDKLVNFGVAGWRGQRRLEANDREIRVAFLSTDFAAPWAGSASPEDLAERRRGRDQVNRDLLTSVAAKFSDLSFGHFTVDFIEPGPTVFLDDMAAPNASQGIADLYGLRVFDQSAAYRDTLRAYPNLSLSNVDLVVWQYDAYANSYLGPGKVGPEPLITVTPATYGRGLEAQNTLVHEMLHFLGLPDLYNEVGYGPMWSGPLSTMSGSWASQGLTGFERWMLGWIPDSQVLCLTAENSTTRQQRSTLRDIRLVTADALLVNPRDNKKLIVIKASDSEAVVIEHRMATGPSISLPRDGISVYTVNSDSWTGVGANVDPRFASIHKPPVISRRATLSTLEVGTTPGGNEWLSTMLPIVADESIVSVGVPVEWSGVTVQSRPLGAITAGVDLAIDWAEVGPFWYAYWD